METTTTLDPKLLPAYQFGSVFLAQKPPEGAGNPQAAARLVEKGIQENPQAWRLYYDLGYIYWLELKRSGEGRRCLRTRLEDPGRPPVDEGHGSGSGGPRRRNRNRRLHVDQHPEQHRGWSLRANAINRLRCLRVDSEVKILQDRVDQFTRQNGRLPSGWPELIAAGLLRRVPADPKSNPYQLVGGRVLVAQPELFPFITRGLPPGQEAGDMPGEKGFMVTKKLTQ